MIKDSLVYRQSILAIDELKASLAKMESDYEETKNMCNLLLSIETDPEKIREMNEKFLEYDAFFQKNIEKHKKMIEIGETLIGTACDMEALGGSAASAINVIEKLSSKLN